MKLTLRYLLAYMDDILRPADAREVGKALAENPTASEIVRRVREVIRLRRIAAAAPLETRPERDANTVAEYLDNLLSPEQMRDFEQSCLDSDEQLAEVGASHQILTLILGGGLSVPDSARQKLKQLATTIPATPPAAGKSSSSRPSPASPIPLKPKSASAVRENLDDLVVPPLEFRRGSSGTKQAALVACVLLFAGAWIYSIVTDQSFQYSSDIASTRPPAALVNPDGAAESELAAAAGNTVADNTTKSTPVDSAVAAASPPATSTGEATPPKRSEPSAMELASNAAIDPAPPALPAISPEAPEAAPTPATMTPAPPASTPPETLVAESTGTPAMTVPPGEEPPSPMPMPAGGEADPAANERKLFIAQPPVCFEPGIRYTSIEGLLVVNSESQPNATIVTSGGEIKSGDTLLTPRYSLADFAMGPNNATWQLRESTSLQVLGATDDACMGLRMWRGRVWLDFPEPTPGLKLRVEIQDRHWLIELPVEPTRIGIEVIPQYATHFEQSPPQGPVLAALFVQGAPVRLQSTPVEWTDIRQTHTLLPGSTQPPVTELENPLQGVVGITSPGTTPGWLAGPPLTLTTSQKRDLRDFTKLVTGSSNLWLDLQGAANDPNPRISELAAELLALGERFRSLVTVLAHSPHEESRTAAIAGLRAWLLRSPGNSQQLQQTLALTFNENTSFIVYRLLWGYNQADARDAAISRQLVDWLRHEHVAVRELSIYWIYALTGQKQNYRPLAPIGTREQGVSAWERHLNRTGALLEPEKTN